MDAVADLRTAFEAFKTHNDQRIAEIEKSGAASAETVAAVDRANAEITALQATIAEQQREHTETRALIEGIEDRLNRPAGNGGNAWKKFSDAQMEGYAAFLSQVEKRDVDPAHVDLDKIGAYSKAFAEYLRGRASADSLRVLNEMSVGSSPDGGYWVDPDTSGRIVEFIRETTPMRRLASVTRIEAGDALEGDYDLDEAGSGGWVDEGSSRSGNTDTPEIWRWRIPVHEQYAEPRTTQKFLDMTRRGDIETWLVRKVSRRFERDENAAFVTGSGVAKPRGFTTYSAGTPAATTVAAYTVIQQVATGAAAALTADGLLNLVFALKSGYRQGAGFGGTRLTEAEIRKLKDGNGNYLWQPDFTQGAQGRLLGFPWEEMADMPEITAAAEPIVFGNLQEAYQIVDLGGIRMLRDDLTTKGRVKFYTTKYAGGDVVNFEAIKLQTVSA